MSGERTSVGTVADLHASAARLTGMADFGDDQALSPWADRYTEGLAVLLESRRAGSTGGAVAAAHHSRLAAFGLTGPEVNERFAGLTPPGPGR
jgi:hypothetical protein